MLSSCALTGVVRRRRGAAWGGAVPAERPRVLLRAVRVTVRCCLCDVVMLSSCALSEGLPGPFLYIIIVGREGVSESDAASTNAKCPQEEAEAELLRAQSHSRPNPQP